MVQGKQLSRCFASLALAMGLFLALLAPGTNSAAIGVGAAPTPGGIFVTGHDPDFHSYYGVGPRHLLQRAVDYVTNGTTSPRMLLVTDLHDPGSGYIDSRTGLSLAGFTFDVADAGSGAAGVADLHTVDFGRYDVIVVASDFGGWLHQAELDVLNARQDDLYRFVNNGGGLVALSEAGAGGGGAGLTTGHQYAFLPFLVSSQALSEVESGNTLSSLGQSMGLAVDDINSGASHTVFSRSATCGLCGLDIVDQDPAGHILSLAGRGQLVGTTGVGAQVRLSSPTASGATIIVGAPQSFTATLANVAVTGGVPVTFTVTGANPQTTVVPTDPNGVATFTVRSVAAGNDTVTASAAVSGGAVASNSWATSRIPAPYATFTAFDSPIGVAASRDRLFVSHYCTRNIDALDSAGHATTFATLPAPAGCNESYMAMAPAGAAGFPAGTLYVTLGQTIFQISPSGAVSSFVTIPSLPGSGTGIVFDPYGTFGHDMLVTGENGDIWRVTAGGGTAKIASVGVVIENPAIAPPAFAPYGGQLLVASENTGHIYAVQPGGTVGVMASVNGAEAVHAIPDTVCNFGTTGMAWFTANYNTRLVGFPGSDFAGLGGQVLASSEFDGTVNLLSSDGTAVGASSFAGGIGQLEGSTFVDCAVPTVDQLPATPPPPVVTDLVEGGYVPGGTFHLTGRALPHAHIACRHRNTAGDIWETDAGDDGTWAVDIVLGGDGGDILYVDATGGGGTSHLAGGGGEGLRIIVDGAGAGPDFVIGGRGGSVRDVYLGDVTAGLRYTDGGGDGVDKLYYSVGGDDFVDWTAVDGGPCGCLPDANLLRFHKIGRRTVSYYVVDKQGHRGPTRTRAITIKAPLGIDSVTATPAAFSTSTLALGGPGGVGIAYRLTEDGTVTVRIYDGGGTLLRTLLNGQGRPGNTTNVEAWDGRDDRGVAVGNCGCHAVVTGRDLFGFPSPDSGRADFVVDSTPPTVAVAGVADGGSYLDSVTPAIAVTDPDGPNGAPASGIDPARSSSTLDGRPYTGGAPITDAGDHTLVITATDKAGNQTVQTVRFRCRHTTTITLAVSGTPAAQGLLLPVAPDGSIQLGALLQDQGVTPLAGRPLTLALGDRSCTATTGANGVATCAVTPPLGPQTLAASYPGEDFYAPSSDSKQSLLFAYPASGQFVLGDLTVRAATPITTVTFWGAQWEKLNSVSGGTQAAFKGYDNRSALPQCGGGWATDPGNSSAPPATIPGYMAVIVTSKVTKSGSGIAGDIVKVVIVKTDGGYGNDPGHAGSGTIVATLCGQ